MSIEEKPRIGITLGDPAGIGAEVLVKVINQIQERCMPVVYGCEWSLREAASMCQTNLPVLETLQVEDVNISKPKDFRYGTVSANCGEIAMTAVKQATRDALAGKLDALMTCPLNKEAIHLAGSEDMGHQEILGRLTKSDAFATILMTPDLRVVHLSTHKSLLAAAQFVTRDVVLARLHLTHTTFEKWGISNARIGVAALNPHNGEGGLLGHEEIQEIAPAIRLAQQAGINAVGPFPSDTIFNRAISGEFDVVLAMYHDQGHIAIKVHDIHRSISATMGLPFVRTSVDHGTAFDIAGKGIANPQSTLTAIDFAIDLSNGQLARGNTTQTQ